jgi:hypothetical protein
MYPLKFKPILKSTIWGEGMYDYYLFVQIKSRQKSVFALEYQLIIYVF